MGFSFVHRLAPFVALLALVFATLMPLPAKAIPALPNVCPPPLGTMTKHETAKAKEVEGKLESALGELTGDTGHQIKGKAKQVQASAMNAAENLKDGAKSMAKKIGNAADDVTS